MRAGPQEPSIVRPRATAIRLFPRRPNPQLHARHARFPVAKTRTAEKATATQPPSLKSNIIYIMGRRLSRGIFGGLWGAPHHCQCMEDGRYRSRAGAQGGVLAGELRRVTTALVIEGPAAEHRAQHGQQPVGHPAEGAAVAMCPGAKPLVVLPTHGVVLDADAGPMIGGVAQATAAASPHH